MTHNEFLEAVDAQILEAYEARTDAVRVDNNKLGLVVAEVADPKEAPNQRRQRPFVVASFRTSILKPPYNALLGEPFREFFRSYGAAKNRFRDLIEAIERPSS